MAAGFTRRSFLKGTAAAAGALAASASFPRTGGAGLRGRELATLLDIRKCIACEECVYACKEANQDKYPIPEKPFPKMFPDRVPVEDWSDKQDVTGRLTPYNWLFIQTAVIQKNGATMEINIPRRCMHCSNPPCVKLCPWGAAQQYENGISRIDSNLCLGGSKCRKACPWKIPQRQTGVGLYLDIMPSFAGNGVMYKCDRCLDRVNKGEVPVCIEVCPETVQSIGPKEEMIEKAHSLAARTGGYIYGEVENGGTNTLYVSPVPFDKLDKAVDKGKGRPHLAGVKNMMAGGSALALAMLIAPVAGAAAAFGKFFRQSREGA